MPLQSGNIYKSIEPVRRTFYGAGLNGSAGKKRPPVFPEFFNTTSTEDPILDVVEYGGVGTMGYKPENERIVEDTIIEGVNKRFAAQTFATMLAISREAIEDSRLDLVKSSSKALGVSARKTPEYLAAQFLDRGFNPSFPAIGDGLPLCSLVHTIPKGGTYANALSTPFSLSEFALEQIMQNLAGIPGTDGLIDPLEPRKLVVPQALGPLAWKLSQTEKQVGSINNDLSFVAGKFEPVVDPYLGSNTRFFMTTSANDDDDTGLFWRWRIKPEFIKDNVDAVQQGLYISRFRAYWGCVDGRAIYGSNAV